MFFQVPRRFSTLNLTLDESSRQVIRDVREELSSCKLISLRSSRFLFFSKRSHRDSEIQRVVGEASINQVIEKPRLHIILISLPIFFFFVLAMTWQGPTIIMSVYLRGI